MKISLIGAGSGCFSVGLVRDWCRSPVLAKSTVSLMDVNEERLNAVYAVCQRYIREIGSDITIEKTLSRAESLRGADIVVNTALTAPHSRLEEGWEIAKKWGFRFGGSYHVMYDEAFWINFYQLRFMEDVTRDILEICPNAWHLMVANPVVAGTTYIQRKYPQAKMVGLCHGYYMAENFGRAFGCEPEELSYQMPGVNHFVWMNECKLKGQDFFPMLDKWIEEKGEEYWKTCKPSTLFSKKRLDFYKKHGVVGIGDTLGWTGACWPWWYHTDDETEKRWGEFSPMDGWNEYFAYGRNAAKKFLELSRDPDAKVSDFLETETDGLVAPIMEALAGGKPVVRVVNVLNRNGLVPGVPEDFEVEVPAYISTGGIQPMTTKPLPKHMIAHILRDRVAPVEMELAAFQEGRLDYLHELVLMDKWATGLDQVSGFTEEILNLPYHKEMKEHYR